MIVKSSKCTFSKNLLGSSNLPQKQYAKAGQLCMQKYVEYDRSYVDMTYYFQILDPIPRVNLSKFEYLYLYFGKSMSEKSENAYESISHEDCATKLGNTHKLMSPTMVDTSYYCPSTNSTEYGHHFYHMPSLPRSSISPRHPPSASLHPA